MMVFNCLERDMGTYFLCNRKSVSCCTKSWFAMERRDCYE